MHYLAHIIRAIKPRYAHLLLLGLLLPISTTHATSVKRENNSKEKNKRILQDLDDEKDPDEPILEDTKEEKKPNQQAPSFDVDKIKSLIKTAIEKVENKETLQKLQNNEMVYFFGNIGAGKSTIINYLLGNELEKYCPEDEKKSNTNEKNRDNQHNTNTQNDNDSDSDDFTCGVEPQEEVKIFQIRCKDPNAIGPKIGQNTVQAETTYPCPTSRKTNN